MLQGQDSYPAVADSILKCWCDERSFELQITIAIARVLQGRRFGVLRLVALDIRLHQCLYKNSTDYRASLETHLASIDGIVVVGQRYA
jgi:hypothetical protein